MNDALTCPGCGAPPEWGPACSWCKRPNLRYVQLMNSPMPQKDYIEVTTIDSPVPQYLRTNWEQWR